jgi:hypothetical protein
MRKYSVSLFLLASLCISSSLIAQDKLNLKFNKISPGDFDLSKSKFDSSAGAVVIADIGASWFEGNTHGWFSMVHKKTTRIKILSKNGFEAANVEVALYTDGKTDERLENVKGFTYNLENGKVVETKLDNGSIFKDKLSKNYTLRKFTLPAIKEGSIIEYTYVIKSEFIFNLQPWAFQGEYPVLWSEYEVAIPDFFAYVSIAQGYHPFASKDQSSSIDNFSVIIPGGTSSNESVSIRSSTYRTKWVMKDVPALKEEKFTSTLRNHVAKIEFQLSQERFPNEPVVDKMGNWYTATDKLMKDEEFGANLEKNNNWLDDDIKAITAGATTKLEKAKKIYYYVRNNFTCTDDRALRMSNGMKSVFKSKNGNVADINLLLIAMLKHENLYSYPVILSTREHGFIHEVYPLMNRFNYVVCMLRIDSTSYFLDASERKLGFNKLPEACYNGYARMIAPEPVLVDLSADSLKERKVTSVFITNDDKGEPVGVFNTELGYFESMSTREKISKQGKEEFEKGIKTAYPAEIKVGQVKIDSLESYDDDLRIHYDLNLKDLATEDIIYFTPLMAEAYKDNYFKAAERFYPVEMPYAFDETYILNMQIPKGYVVDELPKSARVAMNENEGYFEYLIDQADGMVRLKSRVQLRKANFLPEDYEGLRGFFDYVVKKHAEQIVFKKKN